MWETRHTHPIIDFKFFSNPVIVSVLAVSFISFGGMMGAMLLLPVFAQTFLHYTATQSGYLFVPMALALPVFAPLGARLANSFNPRYTVSFGMALSALGLYLLMHLDPAMTSYDFILPLVLFGAGLGLGMAPLTSAATTSVPLHEVGMSSGLLNLTRNIGGAFGIAIFSTILANATNANVLMVAQNSHIIGTTPTVLAEAGQLIIMKAELLSYGTVFGYAAAAMFIGALIALFFLQTTNTSEKDIPPEVLAEARAGG
jgi:DHA2 family multidrug resistance protein